MESIAQQKKLHFDLNSNLYMIILPVGLLAFFVFLVDLPSFSFHLNKRRKNSSYTVNTGSTEIVEAITQVA